MRKDNIYIIQVHEKGMKDKRIVISKSEINEIHNVINKSRIAVEVSGALLVKFKEEMEKSKRNMIEIDRQMSLLL